MVKIAVFDTKQYDRDFLNKSNVELGLNYEFVFIENRLSVRSAEFLSDDTDVVCLFVNDYVDQVVANVLIKKGIKLIALRCAGFNNISFEALKGKIPVVRVPEYSSHGVAEHAFALLLSLNRGIHKASRRTREFDFRLHGLLGFDLFGKTVGVVGTGKIGKAFISIAKGVGMNVLAYDMYPDVKAAEEMGFTYVSDLSEIWKNADVLSLHCPLTDGTRHLIDEATLFQMKDNVVIINTSRGALINTRDLVDALYSNKIAGAGLDVYEEEADYFFEDHSDINFLKDPILAQLLGMNNVLITSHQAFFTREALTNISNITLSNVKEFFTGAKVLSNEVKSQ